MRRGYSAERYLERLAAARASIDDLAVSTDLIVGYPGETDEDFDATLAVVAEADYDSAFTFIFSPRDGTRAAAMVDEFVPDEVIKDRFERLKHVLDRSALRAHVAREGRLEEVLLEGPSRRSENRWSGRTRQGKLVHVDTDAQLRPGALVEVHVDHGAPYHLMGHVTRVIRPPRHKVRIALSVS